MQISQVLKSDVMSSENQILVVGSDDMRTYLKQCLRMSQLAKSKVVEAETAEESIQQVTNHPIDLVIADAVLPGQGGIGLCKNLKIKAQIRSIKVLLISGENPSHITMKFGNDATLSKPFNSKSLSKALVEMTASPTNKNCLKNKHQVARAV